MENIYIGLVYIALGILIRFFPGLMAGYGSLSQNEKDIVKNHGVSNFVMIVFCIMGVTIILAHFIGLWIEQPNFSNLTVGVTLVGTVVIIVGANVMINLRRSN